MVDSVIAYDGDILQSVQIRRGREIRPLWQRLEHLKPEQMVIWVDRFDSLCPIASEWALAQALEMSADINLPRRGQFVRSILCEINRLVWLMSYLGRILGTLGANSLTQQIYILREQVFVMQEELTGGRVLPQALTLGGTRRDLAVGDVQKVRQFIQGWKYSWEKWLELTIGDPLIKSRMMGLLPISRELIDKWAWWGVVGKASGVFYDARKHRPHGAYAFIEFDLGEREARGFTGDAMSRFQVALQEVNLSLKIIDELLKTIPGEMVANPKISSFRPGIFDGCAESAKGPVIAVAEVNQDGHVTSVKLFASGQRVWPLIDTLFVGIRAEDFELAFASLGLDAEEAEI